jgi:hypothetical protein
MKNRKYILSLYRAQKSPVPQLADAAWRLARITAGLPLPRRAVPRPRPSVDRLAVLSVGLGLLSVALFTSAMVGV